MARNILFNTGVIYRGNGFMADLQDIQYGECGGFLDMVSDSDIQLSLDEDAFSKEVEDKCLVGNDPFTRSNSLWYDDGGCSL